MSLSKPTQRRLSYDARNAQLNKIELSQKINQSLLQTSEYQQAKTVLWYLHCRSEVMTYQTVLSELAKQDKRIVIPYCTKDTQGNNQLGLWHLEDLSELVAGTWNILEPPKARWGEGTKEVSPNDIDCVVVPGVAFDKQGGRLGNGAGYYDRLFSQLSHDCTLLALCFNSQLLEQVFMQQYDVYMHQVITETRRYRTL
ncbi:MAG: 5-formyltetrahydrofolate cyclo-ligase [Methyloprofundus sp.]|nr:5-formyltetrahydrofolate cyclo-ligase [Methyloprofundus sp.]